MSDSPLISIVIPCYNASRFIGETLASVTWQSLSDWEVIVIDDGSTDDSRNVIEAWRERLGDRMRTEYGPNRGVSAARNSGTRLARGEFIQYLDADDLLRPDTLLRRVNAIVAGGDVAYCDWQKLQENEDGSFTPGDVVARRMDEVHPIPEIALFTTFWAPPAALLYRRSIVEAVGGWNESLPVIQDARFALDAALAGGRFVHVPGVGADYRVLRGTSLSSRDPVRFIRDCYLNACQVGEYWRAHGGLNEERRKALADCYSYTARTLLHSDDAAFKENLGRLYEVQPRFSLSYPKIAGALTTLVGWRTARKVMNVLSKVKSRARPE